MGFSRVKTLERVQGSALHNTSEYLEMSHLREKYPDAMFNFDDAWLDERIEDLIDNELLRREYDAQGAVTQNDQIGVRDNAQKLS